MSALPHSLFSDPIRHALRTCHAHLATSAGAALRYLPNVCPFASVDGRTTSAWSDLRSVLAQGEQVWLVDAAQPASKYLRVESALDCLQMAFPSGASAAVGDFIGDERSSAETVDTLTARDAADMLALTDVAFPGFFRIGTVRMGSYFGVRREGALIAMGGERLCLPGYNEISGICTHPARRGEGLAARIISRVLQHQRAAGVVSWLQVATANKGAIQLYERLGFTTVRTITLYRLSAR